MTWFFLYKLGLTKDIKNVLEFALNFIKNKTPEEMGTLLKCFYNEVGEGLIYPRAREFIEQLKKDGFDLLLLSSAVDLVAEEFSSHLGIEHTISTHLELKNGKYTAHIDGDIIYSEIKKTQLEKYCFVNDYEINECYVYADHYSDLPLLELAGHGFFVNPNSKEKHLAVEKNIDIMFLY